MDTKEIVIDDDTMEMAVQLSARTGRNVEEILDKYRYFISDGHKKLIKNVSPELTELRAIQRRNKIAFGMVGDFDWKEEMSNELYKKHIG